MTTTPDISVVPKKDKRIPGEPEHRPLAGMSDAEKTEVVMNLVNGQTEPANEMASFLVKRIKSALLEGEELRREHAHIKARLQSIETEVVQLQGAINRYRDDLVECQNQE
jgi:hypothetical protein